MKANHLLKTTLVLLLSIFTSRCTEDESLKPGQPDQQEISETGVPGLIGPALKAKTGSFIIVSSTDELPKNLESHVTSMNGKLTYTISQIGIAIATSKDPEFASKCSMITGIKSVIKDYSAKWLDPPKERINPSSKVKNPPSSGDDDFFFDLQWGHDAINTPEAWKKGYRGEGTKIAILDTGFDLEHPDLAANVDISCSANFIPDETLQFDPEYLSSHGTITAGIAAAPDNGLGIIGVAPKARLMLVKVLSDGGSGPFSALLQGIVHAACNGADVINMSLGVTLRRDGKFVNDNGTPEDPSDDFLDFDPQILELIDALSKATNFAHKKGVTLFASAGNDNRNADEDKILIELPAQAPHVISISATAPKGWANNPSTNLDLLASYSNSGISLIDFAAPGGDLWNTVTGECTVAETTFPCSYFDLIISTDYGGWSLSAGTSEASPFAAGVAALIISKHKGKIKPDDVKAILKASADDIGQTGKDVCFGYGRVNAYRSVFPQSQPLALSN